MKSITTKSITTKTLMRKRRAVSAIVGIMLGLGLTAVAAGGLYVMTSDLSDSAVSITSVEIQNARAYNTGNTAYVSLSIKNTGTDAASDLSAVVLLVCNGEVAAKATLTNAALEAATTDCVAAQYTSPPTASTGPGTLPSILIGGADIDDLAPGGTASISGGIAITDSASTTARNTGDKIAFAVGQEYLIEVSGTTAAGEPIIQTATVRVR